MDIRSVPIKDTTKEEREDIIRKSLDCGGGCENCSSCWLGGGTIWISPAILLVVALMMVRA